MHVELRQLTKRLGGVEVLSTIDLELAGGNIVALLGANGAGKTTLLHVLGGLYQADDGEVLIDGEVMARSRLDQRRRLHYLPDIPTLNPGHTPLDYILFAVEAYGLTSETDDDRIIELLQQFDLLPVADSPCRSLSRGQRYKATLVAMLAIDPEMWILDEPFTSGMDPLGLIAMREHMDSAKRRGRLIVYSTQLVEIAKQNSDLVCVLSASEVAAFGSADSLAQSAKHTPQLNQLLLELSGAESDALLPDHLSESNVNVSN